METTETLNLRQVKEMAFALVPLFAEEMDRVALTDGNARWVPCPFSSTRMAGTTRSPLVVSMSIALTSSDEPYALSYMLAKPLPYLLYAACVDIIRREPHEGGGRAYGVGEVAAQTITLGGVTTTATVSAAIMLSIYSSEADSI